MDPRKLMKDLSCELVEQAIRFRDFSETRPGGPLKSLFLLVPQAPRRRRLEELKDEAMTYFAHEVTTDNAHKRVPALACRSKRNKPFFRRQEVAFGLLQVGAVRIS